jgi:hypothetical protein
MDTLRLSPSEKRTLQQVAQGEFDLLGGLDWLALQRLKQIGLVEQRSTGPAITVEGRRALQRLISTP